MKNSFLTLLFTPAGITNIFEQSTGNAWGESFSGGQIVFSPDGSKFIRFTPGNGLDVYDFNRCDGLLSNAIHEHPMSVLAGGCAVSADSRFVYVPNNQQLFQYDLRAANILSSRELVAQYDGHLDPFPTNFYQALLGPDHRIYISATSTVRSLHVIKYPERKGKDCEVLQHSLQLPVFKGKTMPNIPNFRLGPLDGSPCDTLGLNNNPIAEFRYELDSLDERRITFRNTSSFNPSDFLWDFGDGNRSREFAPEHLYYTSGTYKVCLTASNMYSADMVCREIRMSLSMDYEVPVDSIFTLRPNPAHDFITITFREKVISDVLFELYSSH
jgi:hypothetical protein